MEATYEDLFWEAMHKSSRYNMPLYNILHHYHVPLQQAKIMWGILFELKSLVKANILLRSYIGSVEMIQCYDKTYLLCRKDIDCLVEYFISLGKDKCQAIIEDPNISLPPDNDSHFDYDPSSHVYRPLQLITSLNYQFFLYIKDIKNKNK